jgi:hypothetical protein
MGDVVDIEEARANRGVPYELTIEDGDVVLRIPMPFGGLKRAYRFTPAVADTLARRLLVLAASARNESREP